MGINGNVVQNPKKLRFLFPEPLGVAENLALRLKTLSYLTAERVGPRDSYPLQDPSATQVVGPRGANAVGMLYQRRDEPVLAALALDDGVPKLLAQVEARMGRFFPGTSLANTVPSSASHQLLTAGLRHSANAPALSNVPGILHAPQFRVVLQPLCQRNRL